MYKDIDMELMHAFRKASRKMRPQGMHKGMCHRHGPEGPHRMMRPHLHREIILSVILDREAEGVHQKDLTEELKINPSSVSEAIDKLEESGYLVRTTDPADHRATLLVLTDLGKARASEIKDQRKAHMDAVFGKLTEEEKQQLLTLLTKMIED